MQNKIMMGTAEIARIHKVSQRTAQRWKRDKDSRCFTSSTDAEEFSPQSAEIVRSPGNEALWRWISAATLAEQAALRALEARAHVAGLWDKMDAEGRFGELELVPDGMEYLGNAFKAQEPAYEQALAVMTGLCKYDHFQKFTGFPYPADWTPPTEEESK